MWSEKLQTPSLCYGGEREKEAGKAWLVLYNIVYEGSLFSQPFAFVLGRVGQATLVHLPGADVDVLPPETPSP